MTSGDIISQHKGRLAFESGNIKKDWGGRISVALIYPNTYRLGMSNLGFQVVYELLNKRKEIVAERFFLPDEKELQRYSLSGKSIISMESQVPLCNFDLIAFSFSFENDYINLLRILELSGIPLLSSERITSFPLIMAGGVTTYLNPEPISPFIDFFLLGEAETNLNEFLDLFIEYKSRDVEKEDILKKVAAGIEGLYVPVFYTPSYNDNGTLKSFSAVFPDSGKVSISSRKAVKITGNLIEAGMGVQKSCIMTPDTEFGNRVLIETGRGCGRSCRFCAAGYVYRPPRIQKEDDLRTMILSVLGSCDQLGLLGTAVSDVPYLEDLTSMIVNGDASFSLSSLRADAVTETLLNNLIKSGQKTLSIAPEAGSERLRLVINKHLTKNQIIEAVRLISRIETFSVRLYFLIGLPTETDKDIDEMIELVKSIKHNMVKESAMRGRIGKIHLSVNCFVPKPFTPFQWAGMDDLQLLKKKQKKLQKAFAKEGGITMTSDIPKWSYIQTLLSIGDRRVSSILLDVHKNGGDWKKALRYSNLNPDFFVYRSKNLDELLPWDFIDHGISKDYLKHEYERALKAEESETCHIGSCIKCGVCSNIKGLD